MLVAYEKKLRKILTSAHFRHVHACAKMAAELAGCYNVSPRRAFVAGLLHDCARDLTRKQLERIVRKYQGRHCPLATRRNQKLWHTPAGIFLARHMFKIKDSGILRAIGLHSTGAPKMSALDKIIYVADYCEPLRKHVSAKRVREQAFHDLSGAVRSVMIEKIDFLSRTHQDIHPLTIKAAKQLKIKLP